MISAVFFLWRQGGLCDWTQTADLLIDLQKLAAQFSKAMVFGNFALSLCQAGG
jgi:hypothetical protein